MVFRAESPRQTGQGLIDAILRYRGAGGKEAIRDADRNIRDQVARQYGADVQRIRTVARQLADQRRLGEVGPVDEFANTLQHFVDRVSTATYGYGGLFAEVNPDPGVAAQLRQFDQRMLAGDTDIAAAIDALEASAANNGDVAAPARAGAAAARALLRQFDLRAEVMATGKPADRESVLQALGPELPELPHPAWNLDLGVALSVLGDDRIVDAKIGIEGDGIALRLFRLGEAPEEWLLVPRQTDLGLARVRPVEVPAAGHETSLAGATYRAVVEGQGRGEVVGVSGGSGIRPVRFVLLTGESDPQARALLLDWETERQAFAGTEVHPNDVEIFGPPLGE
ncbi:MAG: hypothetical protein IT337_08515 [Thermomicrobiales bacterium]|nr:hypothetical protein [Thermomicrobiales bacterium]